MITARTVSRLFSGAMALSSGTVLGIARWLSPSPLGYSTHRQLGLGECTFLHITGYPCPMCGCTTTFSLAAHLHLIGAILNQPFGAMLFVGTVVAFGVSVAELVQPTDRWSRIAERLAPWESYLASAFLIFMTAGWIYKIAVMRWFV